MNIIDCNELTNSKSSDLTPALHFLRFPAILPRVSPLELGNTLEDIACSYAASSCSVISAEMAYPRAMNAEILISIQKLTSFNENNLKTYVICAAIPAIPSR